MKLIADNLSLYFEIIYKPKIDNFLYVGMPLARPEVGEEKTTVSFFILKEVESPWMDNEVKLIWLTKEGEKKETNITAYKLANLIGAIEPITTKKELTMCLLKGLS